jgi:hypothetical protein
MDFLLKLHGEMRWLVALAAAVVLIRSLAGWLRGTPFGGLDRGLMTVLTILLDLNLVLGLVLLVGLPGGLLPNRLEHALTMVLAITAAHSWALWRNSPDSRLKFRNNLFAVLAVLVLVVAGVVRLRGGWTF